MMPVPLKQQPLDIHRGRGQFPLRHAIRLAVGRNVSSRETLYHSLAWGAGTGLFWGIVNGIQHLAPTLLMCFGISLAIGYLSPILWRWRLVPARWGTAAMFAANGALSFVVGYVLFFGALIGCWVAFQGAGSITSGLLISAAVVGFNGFFFSIIGYYQVMGHDQERREWRLARQRDRLQQLADEARQVALRSQINPHFFFNALNTIAALIPERPADAERAVELLATALRPVLTREQPLTSTLEQELRVARAYAEIEQLRFGDRVAVTWEPGGASLQAILPSLCLQPLIENAFRHGAAKTAGPFEILVGASVEGGVLVLEVRSGPSGPEPPVCVHPAPQKPGHALHNIAARARALCGPEASLEVMVSEGAVPAAIARLQVPLAPANAVPLFTQSARVPELEKEVAAP